MTRLAAAALAFLLWAMFTEPTVDGPLVVGIALTIVYIICIPIKEKRHDPQEAGRRPGV